MNENVVSVAVTGLTWMGSGIGFIETAIEKLFREAREEITLTAYTITGGADILLDWMEVALDRGVLVSIIANRLEGQSAEARTRLRGFASRYPHFRLCDFARDPVFDLHAKVIIVDRRTALVGSSNLSRRGLLNNHELAVLGEGLAAADIARAFDLLLAAAVTVRG
jgi:cardiolipin synthase